MTTTSEYPIAETSEVTAAAPTPAPPAPEGNPGLIGVPTFLVGSIALALVLTGFVPAAAAGASIPIIMTATGFGQAVAAIWAAMIGQNAVASIFGIFTGFWTSYAALVLGLTHGWFGVTDANAVRTQELFLSSWLVLIVLLTAATLRLPSAFTLLFALIDLALLLVLLGTAQGSTTLVKAGGLTVFSFAAVGAYLFVDSMNQATGGRALPLGKPVLS
jgi:succinate-acetate transporter protein